jgi:hypothetical protein
MIRMNEENTRAGTLFVRRIEDLLQRSTLPPETVLNIMRTAHANPDSVLLEIERLQHEQRTIK